MTGDDAAMRATVELPDTQAEVLARFCKREGISTQEAIRQAVDKLVASEEAEETRRIFQKAFGLWGSHQPDGRAYVEALREEWEGH